MTPSTPNIALMLFYEPTSERKPVALARVEDRELTLQVARAAIDGAEARASEIAREDDYLGELERAEVQRLRAVLGLLVPGFTKREKLAPALTH